MNTELNAQKLRSHHRRRRELRQQVLDYLLTHPCVECGFSDPRALDFDHLRNKVDSIAKMVNDCKPWAVIEDEITKCQVLCANHHRIKTHGDLNWWKDM